MAIYGRATDSGNLKVNDFTFAGVAPTPSLPSTIPNSPILFISGLLLGETSALFGYLNQNIIDHNITQEEINVPPCQGFF